MKKQFLLLAALLGLYTGSLMAADGESDALLQGAVQGAPEAQLGRLGPVDEESAFDALLTSIFGDDASVADLTFEDEDEGPSLKDQIHTQLVSCTKALELEDDEACWYKFLECTQAFALFLTKHAPVVEAGVRGTTYPSFMLMSIFAHYYSGNTENMALIKQALEQKLAVPSPDGTASDPFLEKLLATARVFTRLMQPEDGWGSIEKVNEVFSATPKKTLIDNIVFRELLYKRGCSAITAETSYREHVFWAWYSVFDKCRERGKRAKVAFATALEELDQLSADIPSVLPALTSLPTSAGSAAGSGGVSANATGENRLPVVEAGAQVATSPPRPGLTHQKKHGRDRDEEKVDEDMPPKVRRRPLAHLPGNEK